jgi:hypothetical protein
MFCKPPTSISNEWRRIVLAVHFIFYSICNEEIQLVTHIRRCAMNKTKNRKDFSFRKDSLVVATCGGNYLVGEVENGLSLYFPVIEV